MKFRSPRTWAYGGLRQRQIARPSHLSEFRKAIQETPVPAEEVPGLLAIGLKSEEELDPDFPATGEEKLPVPVLAEPRKTASLLRGGAARESTTKAGPTSPRPLEAKSEADSRGGQLPLCNLNHVFSEVQRRFGV